MKNAKNIINVTNVTFVIHPTEFSDYDVLGIGSWQLLAEMSHEDKSYQLIVKSKFGGVPILIIDTCDTLRDALSCIKSIKRLRKEVI